MKNKNVPNQNVKIESVPEYLERGGEIKKIPPSRRKQNRTSTKPKLFNRHKHGPRTQFLPNPIY